MCRAVLGNVAHALMCALRYFFYCIALHIVFIVLYQYYCTFVKSERIGRTGCDLIANWSNCCFTGPGKIAPKTGNKINGSTPVHICDGACSWQKDKDSLKPACGLNSQMTLNKNVYRAEEKPPCWHLGSCMALRCSTLQIQRHFNVSPRSGKKQTNVLVPVVNNSC